MTGNGVIKDRTEVLWSNRHLSVPDFLFDISQGATA